MERGFPPLPQSGMATAAPLNQLRSMTTAEVISHVSNLLALHLHNRHRGEPSELVFLCYALARGIDYAVSRNDIPPQAHDLPSLVKQVYQRRNDDFLKSAVMVLMISIKNACRSGWFQIADTEELLTMSNELSSSFCTTGSVSFESTNSLNVISLIMPRFYPRIKLGRLITSFEVKPGYEILAADFNISRNIIITTGERIRLLVVQTDNMETSSCIISPPQANFLVNGKGVDRRTNVSMDNGPQFPTDITKMLKYGTNLIQTIGYFSGNYIIAIASMSSITSSDAPVFQDYVQPVVAALASDSEIVEGPSRISLKCPISFGHIRTPVKGRLCKHHQCFDYDNFMEMNSRKPSWRCPHCNQPVSCVDIRIDQNMVKILREAGEGVSDVLISTDGSWKVATENNVYADQLPNQMLTGQQDGTVESESNRFSSTLADVVDLTIGEDGGGDAAITSGPVESSNGCANWSGNNTCETEDWKPLQDVQGFSVSDFLSEPRPVNGTSETTQEAPRQVGNDIWSGISLSASALNGSVAHTARADARTVAASEFFAPTGVLNPVITDAISSVPNRDSVHDLGGPQPISTLQNTLVRQITGNLQLQQSRFGSSIIHREPERPSIPRHVNRAPIAVQALPVQTQSHTCHQRPWTSGQNLNSMISNTSPSIPYLSSSTVADILGGLNAVNGDIHSMMQNRDNQDQQYLMNQAFQQAVELPASNQVGLRPTSDQLRGVGAIRPSLQPHRDLQTPHHQHVNHRTHQTNRQSTNILPQSSRFSSMQVQQASQSAAGISASLASQHTQLLAGQHPVQLARLRAGAAAQHQASRSTSSFSTTADSLRHSVGEHSPSTSAGGFPELPPEQNWRPTGRMRGSLTGTAYSAALNQYMSQPTQSVQYRPPTSNLAPAAAAEQPPLLLSDLLDTW